MDFLDVTKPLLEAGLFMPNIQMQKTGAEAACQGDTPLPASDLGVRLGKIEHVS